MESRQQKKERCIQFIKNNLDLGNPELAELLGITTRGVIGYMERNGIKRSEEQKQHIMRMAAVRNYKKGLGKMDMTGENNPSWKGGISKNHYHYKKLQKERYPERVKARRKVYHAVKTGKLTREPCEICGGTPSFAHHEDYGKPLEVNWLCRKHHRGKHGGRY